jgi:hypothetical protein
MGEQVREWGIIGGRVYLPSSLLLYRLRLYYYLWAGKNFFNTLTPTPQPAHIYILSRFKIFKIFGVSTVAVNIYIFTYPSIRKISDERGT